MTAIRYLSVCSGIEAATVAWHPLGWEPVAFADVEPFPSAVLAHHYPQVPNLGDMTQFNHWPDYAIDLLVGGTPCQAFSVAGLRQGLADPRGNLALVFLALARRYRPRWVVWENVPGVHSSWSDVAVRAADEAAGETLERARRAAALLGLDPGILGEEGGGGIFEEADQTNDFDCFVAGLEQLGYGTATRILDAQYFGVAQRRERVFVVGHLGAWQPAAAVLLEPESLRGDPPPSRQARQGLAGTLTRRALDGSSPCGGDGREGLLVAGTLNPGAHPGGYNGQDATNGLLISEPITLAVRGRGDGHNLEYRQDGTANAILTPSGGRAGIGVGAVAVPASIELAGDGPVGAVTSKWAKFSGGPAGDECQNLVAVGVTIHGTDKTQKVASMTDVAGALRASTPGRQENSSTTVVLTATPFDPTQITSRENRSNPQPGDPAPTLAKGAHPPAIAFSCKDSGQDSAEELSPTLRALEHDRSHANGGGQVAVVHTLRGEGFDASEDGTGRGTPLVAEPITASEGKTYSNEGSGNFKLHNVVPGEGMAVRRLTPRECERLQGFPDDYTLIPWGGKPPAECPDGHRYRALGNSMAVPVMRWIGGRIAAVDEILKAEGELKERIA